MANRRQFIQSGVALSVAPYSGGLQWQSAAAAVPLAALVLERFVFDNRFAEARQLAAHAKALGIVPAAFAGDVTPLWYEQLDLRWKAAPMALAGITTSAGLFVLETLAADRRMRVVYRGEHSVAEGGYANHALAGPASLVTHIASTAADASWEAAVGRALAQCPLGHPATGRIDIGTRDSGAVRGEALYTWIIAPRDAVAVQV